MVKFDRCCSSEESCCHSQHKKWGTDKNDYFNDYLHHPLLPEQDSFIFDKLRDHISHKPQLYGSRFILSLCIKNLPITTSEFYIFLKLQLCEQFCHFLLHIILYAYPSLLLQYEYTHNVNKQCTAMQWQSLDYIRLIRSLTANNFIWISASATSADGSALSNTVSTLDVNLVCFDSRLIFSIMSTALSGRSSSTLVSTRERWSYL